MPEEISQEDIDGNETWGLAPPFVASRHTDDSQSASKFRTDLQRLSWANDALLEKGSVGRFQLLRRIGEGGMGTVYAAFDQQNDRNVAIKILHPSLSQQDELRRRFQREARLLAEVDSIYVTKLFEIAEDDGYIYLVQELVDGQTLAESIKSNGALSEQKSIGITIDVATALTELHARGIVHRDVKPENILLCSHETGSQKDAESFLSSTDSVLAKLTDLGIARQEETLESIALTSAHSLLGTPLYMSPEHFYGGSKVDDRSDLYSLGATFFHALTGQPPFIADNALLLADAHRHSPTPNPQAINRTLSDGVCEVVMKSLQKRPDLRYASAREFLVDLTRLQRGEATSVSSHPLLPDEGIGQTKSMSYTWELNCSPEELWPYVSNTERLNRAINLPSVEFSMAKTESGERQRFAEFRLAGIRMRWKEHMFEWVEAQRMSVLREFQKGPARWLTSVVELNRRANGGTTLTHSFKANARHAPGMLFIKFQLQFITRRALDRVYRRIDAVVANRQSAGSIVDAFEETPSIRRRSAAFLDKAIDRLRRRNLDRSALLKVTDYVRSAPAQEISHIRPRALAKKLGFPAEPVIEVCLQGVQDGLFELSWEVICPSCRISTRSADTISNIQNHERCEACDFDFKVDFATGVEVVLRTNSQIRERELGKYCIGGPAHSPHVVAQARVAANETVRLGLELAEGRYVLRGPQLPYSIQLDVTASAEQELLFVDLTQSTARLPMLKMKPDRQVITVSNQGTHEVLLRVERSSTSDDAITALQAASMPFFKKLFPQEILSAQQVTSVQIMTFVIVTTQTSESLASRFGELESCDLLKDHLERLIDFATICEGVFVRPFREGGMLVFRSPASAIQAVNQIVSTIPIRAGVMAWQPIIVVHQGPTMVTTLNGQLEYLGSAIRIVQDLTTSGKPGEITTTSVFADSLKSANFELLPDDTPEAIHARSPGETSTRASAIRFRPLAGLR